MKYNVYLRTEDPIETDQMLKAINENFYVDIEFATTDPELRSEILIDQLFVDRIDAFINGWHACSQWKDKC